MKLEVIATTVEDAKISAENGADRLELVSAIEEGGLTPSYDLAEAVINAVEIPVNVMIRPHSHSFHYTEDELRTMAANIRVMKRLGAAGVVVGTLTKERELDSESLALLLKEAEGLDVTFHRAFDEVADQFDTLEKLTGFSAITRILTSGGKPKATEAAEQIAGLEKSAVGISIMAGSGLTLETLEEFIGKTRVKEVHFGSAVRLNDDPLQPVLAEKVAAVKRMIEQISK